MYNTSNNNNNFSRVVMVADAELATGNSNAIILYVDESSVGSFHFPFFNPIHLYLLFE